jgi:hypothetical protein
MGDAERRAEHLFAISPLLNATGLRVNWAKIAADVKAEREKRDA